MTSHSQDQRRPIAAKDLKPAYLISSRFAQEREFRQSPTGVAWNNVAICWRLEGLLDDGRLREAVDAVVDRHEVLRSALLDVGGGVLQKVLPSVPSCVRQMDARLEGPRLTDELERIVEARLREPFPLTGAPMIRVTNVRVSKEERFLIIIVPHLVWDASSTALFLHELDAHYGHAGARPDAVPALPIQFGDFAAWERAFQSAAASDYWRQQLAGYTRHLEFPFAKGPIEAQLHRPNELSFLLVEPEITHRLELLARSEGVTLNIALLTAYVLWLSTRTGQEDVTVAVADANRHHREVRSLIGFFIGHDLIRVDLSQHPSYRDLLKRVQSSVRGAYDHPLPIEQQIGDLGIDALNERRPFSDAFYNFVPREIFTQFQAQWLQFCQAVPYRPSRRWVKFPVRASPEGAQLDLSLVLTSSGQIEATFAYDMQVFDGQAIRAASSDLTSVVHDLVSDPERRLNRVASVVAPGARGA
jgi:hypothetical protein